MRFLRTLAQISAGISAIIGIIAFLGWLLNLPYLASYGASLIPMAPSTSLIFFVLGTTVLIHVRNPKNRAVSWVNRVITSLLFATSLLLLYFSSEGIHPQGEHFGFSALGTVSGAPVGHMSPLTALCFVLFALSFLAALSHAEERHWSARASFGLAFIGSVISMILLLAYLIGSPVLYGSAFIPPALPTALAFFAIGASLLAVSTAHVWSSSRKGDEPFVGEGYMLLMVFVLMTFGVLIAGYLYYHNQERNIRTQTENQLTAIAQLKIDEISQWRKERLGDAAAIYDNPAFTGLARRLIENPKESKTRFQIERWFLGLEQSSQYDAMLLLDDRGGVRIAIPGSRTNVSTSVKRSVLNNSSKGNTGFLDFHRNEYDGRIYLTILVPVLEPEGKNIIATVMMRINPDSFIYPLINRWPVPSRSAETLILRREGNDALFLNEIRFRKDAALNLRMPFSDTLVPGVKAALGGEGIVEGIDYRGVRVIAYIQSIPGSPWFLVAKIDQSELYGPLQDKLWMTVILMGALIVGSGMGVGLVWRHQRGRFYRQQYEAVNALTTSELRYHRLFEAARDGILILDAETAMVVDVNPFLVQMLGYSREQFFGKKVWELGLFKDILANKSHFAELQEKEFIQYENLPLETGEGNTIHVEFVSHVYYVNDKKVIQCNIRDITNRRLAEEALRESERRFRSIVEGSEAGYFFIDKQGIICDVNKAWVKLYRYDSPEQILGKHFAVIQRIEDLEEAREFVEGIMKGDTRYTSGEFSRKCRDGTTGYHTFSARPVSRLGEVLGIEGFIIDTTGHKIAQEALHESEERFHTMANSMSQLAWVARADGFIYWYNRRWYEYTGTQPEQMEGWGWQMVHDPSVLPEVMKNWTGSIASGMRFEMSFPLRGADGQFRTFLTRVEPMKDSAGRVVQWFGTNTDVETLKQAEEAVQKLNLTLETRVSERTSQLEAANKELEAFSYSVSHDLRAPLRSIDGFSQIVLEEYENKLDDEGKRLLNVIRSNTQKMGELITDLLNLSRITRDEMKVDRVDMAKLVNSTYCEIVSPEARGQYSLSVEALPNASCDPSLMHQVWTNLISNAIKFTSKSNVRRIEIRGRAEDGMAIYSIRDTGVGFDPLYTHKLFGVFQRLHKTEEFEGTGVGLAIVQRIVHRHGGKVWAEGKVGEGATFWFSIPSREE